MKKVKGIKNIIFDMGGVLFDLNPLRCVEAFEAIGAMNTAVYVREFRTEDLFHLIEVGGSSTEDFCDEVRRIDGIGAGDDEIVEAWNSLLEPTPAVKREELKRLKDAGFRIFLLSNTNDMHWQRAKSLITNSEHDIGYYFEKIFLSYEMGLRKPHRDIFVQTLDDAGIKAEETLFVDDNVMNVRAAEQLGIIGFHESADHQWVNLLRREIA